MPGPAVRRTDGQGSERSANRAPVRRSESPDTNTSADSPYPSPDYADDPDSAFAGALDPDGPAPQPEESSLYDEEQQVQWICSHMVDDSSPTDEPDYRPQPTPTDPEVRSAPPAVRPQAAAASTRLPPGTLDTGGPGPPGRRHAARNSAVAGRRFHPRHRRPGVIGGVPGFSSHHSFCGFSSIRSHHDMPQRLRR